MQVKAAKKLLKTAPQRGRRRKLHGVPVFTAQNLNIAIATNDGIRWYVLYNPIIKESGYAPKIRISAEVLTAQNL